MPASTQKSLTILRDHLNHVWFAGLSGRIHRCHGKSSGSQNHVLQQELSRQGEQGETGHRWRNHENGQRSGKQDQTEQTDVAQPHPCQEEDGGNDFEHSKDVDKRVKREERQRCVKQHSDGCWINELQRSYPEKDEG